MRRLVALGVAVAACSSHGNLLRYASQLDPNEPFRYTLDVDVFKLKNGLTVVLEPQHDTDLVTVDMRYEAGSAEDPAGKTGLAHFVEHLTFLGRTAAGEPTLQQRLMVSSLAYNANTSEDYTHYDASALVDRWPELLRVEAARLSLTCNQIDGGLFDRERAVVAQEVLQRREQLLDPVLVEVFGPGHPYAHSIGGRDLATLTHQDVCAFLDAHYAPDRAILVVGGAFDRVKVRAAVAGAFGGASRRGAPPRTIPPPTPRSSGGIAEVVGGVDRPTLLFAYPRPRFGTLDALHHRFAIWLAGFALQKFELDRDDVLSVEHYDLGGDTAGATVFALELAPGADAAKVAHDAQNALDDIELDRPRYGVIQLRAFFYGLLIDGFDDLETRARVAADYMEYTGDASLDAVDIERVRRLDARAVLGYLQDHVIEAHPTIVHVTPAANASASASIEAIRSKDAPELSPFDLPVDEREADRVLAVPPLARVRDDEIRLPNGLRVIFAPRPTSALFAAVITFPAGVADDPPGQVGAARLAAGALETDFTGGTTHTDYERWLAAVNAGTAWTWVARAHTTSFQTMGAASFADWHLWRLNANLESGRYDAKHVPQLERDHVITPERHRLIAMTTHLFGADDPIARDLAGSHVGADALDAFRNAHYRVAGATLVVAGAFNRAKIEAEVRELFGAWPATSATAPAPAPPPPPAGPIVIAEEDRTRAQVHVWIACRARSTWTDSAAVRRVAIQIAEQRLAAIREELGASYGVSARYRSDLSTDVLEITGDVNAQTAGATIARIVQEAHTLHDRSASLRAELVRGRRAALRDALAQEASTMDIVGELVFANEGAPLDRLVTLPAQIARVRPDDVGALFADDLDPSRMVVYISGPGAHAAAEAAGLAPITDVGQ